MAGSVLIAPVTTGAAHAGTPPLPVCGQIASCVHMAEQLAQPYLGQPCGNGVVTNCLQPAVIAVADKLNALAGTDPLGPVEQAVSTVLNTSIFNEANDLAATAVNQLTACADGTDPTCNTVKGLAVSIATTIVDTAQVCGSGSTAAICQELTAMVDSVVTTALADISQCAAGSAPSCNAATQLAETVASLATSFVSACVSGSDATCTAVVQLAEDTAAQALATAEACASGSASTTCGQVIALAQSVEPLLNGAASACLNGDNATCYLVGSTAEGTVYTAGTTADSCLSDDSSTCGSAVALADTTAGQAIASFLNTLVCAQAQDVCTLLQNDVTNQQVGTSAGYDFADNSPTDVSLWDFTDPPAMPVSPDNTVTGTTDAAFSSTGLSAGTDCKSSWYYDIDKGYGIHKSFKPGADIRTLNNYSAGWGEVTMDKTFTKSLAITLSASAEVELNVIFTSVKTTFGVSIQGSVSYTDNVGYHIQAAPWKMTHLAGGAYGYKTRGHYYHINGGCFEDVDKGWNYAFTPYKGDYNAWTEAAVPPA